MRRSARLPLLLLLLLTAACSGAADDGRKPEGSRTAPSASGGSPDAASRAASRRAALDVPPGATLLVPVTTGTGDAALPVFRPESDVYSFHAMCSGKGSMTIAHRADPHPDPVTIRCTGRVTTGLVHTDVAPQKLSVRTRGGTVRWTLAVSSDGTGGGRTDSVDVAPRPVEGKALVQAAGRHGNASFTARSPRPQDPLGISVDCRGKGTLTVSLAPTGVRFALPCVDGRVTNTYNQIALERDGKSVAVTVTAPSAVRWAITVEQ